MDTKSDHHAQLSAEMHPTWPSFPATSLIPEQFNEGVKEALSKVDWSETREPVNALGVSQHVPKGLN